jgi:hypothetical protein
LHGLTSVSNLVASTTMLKLRSLFLLIFEITFNYKALRFRLVIFLRGGLHFLNIIDVIDIEYFHVISLCYVPLSFRLLLFIEHIITW